MLARPETDGRYCLLPFVLATLLQACPLGSFYMIRTKGLQAGISCRNPSSYPLIPLQNKTKAKGNEEAETGTGIFSLPSPPCLTVYFALVLSVQGGIFSSSAEAISISFLE